MARDQVIQKISQILENDKQYITQYIEKALDSGAVDIDKYEDNFMLPKIIMCAIYSEMSNQYTPFTKEGKAEVENVKQFL